MTSRLYYTDAYATAFDGRITEISADGQRVYLDRTAFYPTSGGQPFDLGSLGGAQVADVVDEDDARRTRPRRATLRSRDRRHRARRNRLARRFDHMQQHTGQHLLSAVFADLFGYETVSVHFGADRSSLDLDVGAIDAAQLGEAEAARERDRLGESAGERELRGRVPPPRVSANHRREKARCAS